MTISEEYFHYPHRKKGLDHNLFEMRYLKDAPKFVWGDGKSLALWLTIDVEFFPLDMGKSPFLPSGGMARPYPDIWNFTTREYGNRVGIYRLIETINHYGAKATAFVQSVIAEEYPVLMKDLVKSGFEIACGGIDMSNLHTSELAKIDEAILIKQATRVLQKATGGTISGWHSPCFSESFHTPELVAKEDFSYICDWVNDDMPFPITVADKTILSLPKQYELSDRKLIFEQQQTLSSFEYQLRAAYKTLKAEASPDDGRILSVSLSPWVIAQPYRIQALERFLEEVMADEDVISMTGTEIAAVASKTFFRGDV
ncbi:polysaccharide deacetylase family protein [Patescibacteria group bacterium]|nr:polysaccharide deacetylase family protein [Patescibacteria group bacterium]